MKTLKQILILILKFLLASGVVTVLASIFSTQRVVSGLGAIGGKVGLGDRLSMTAYDAMHFGSLYWIFISLAFLLAFISAWLLHKGVKFGRPVIFTVAGMAAMLVMLLAMEQVFFGVPIVAGARDSFGFLLQMFAGGIGGFVYAKLTTSKIQISKSAQ